MLIKTDPNPDLQNSKSGSHEEGSNNSLGMIISLLYKWPNNSPGLIIILILYKRLINPTFIKVLINPFYVNPIFISQLADPMAIPYVCNSTGFGHLCEGCVFEQYFSVKGNDVLVHLISKNVSIDQVREKLDRLSLAAAYMWIAESLEADEFLHDKVKPQVVHRDIRASNILLDEDFGAHLMGVGLSKFVPWEVMHERRVMAGGTHGYLAPEFVYRNELTTKSDVYNFGVLLLEIVSGRKPAQAVDSVG